jgi:anthranilate synthase component 2
MSVVLIDAFDSFVHIIEQYLADVDDERTVLRAAPDVIQSVELLRPDFIVLGPGPGHPDVSGHVELVRHFAGRIPILGVCLGHQAIGAAFGASVVRTDRIRHGKTSTIKHDGRGLYGLGSQGPRKVTRYHSLVIDESTLPADLVVTARSEDDGLVMGVRHRALPVEGVQFHPESIGTVDGAAYFRGFHQAYVE